MNQRLIEINGTPYLRRDILELRREQLRARSRTRQTTLLELRVDARPPSERTASGRYQEPSLFAILGQPRRSQCDEIDSE